MTDDLALQLLWVSAHHGLRRLGARQRHRNMDEIEQHVRCWRWTHEITAALGNPPAPGGPVP